MTTPEPPDHETTAPTGRRVGTPFPAAAPTGDPAPTEPPLAEPPVPPRRRPRWTDRLRGPAAVFAGLYALAVAVMLVGIDSHPGFLYNWENYAVRGAIDLLRDPDGRVLELPGGLMTDSGRTWTVAGPIWLGLKLGGMSLAAIRLPIVLISALAVPLTWLLGRRVAVMLVGIDSHPGFLYNWENYAVRGAIDLLRDPDGRVLELPGGLMTDSGRTWTVAGPIWLGLKLGGMSLTAIRLPIVLISALAVPLTWLLGRRVATPPVALAAAGLVLFSPVFLLYGRSATLPGVSLTLALLGFVLLHGTLTHPGATRWLLGLNLTMVVGGYGYAPLRFLWPIALVLFLVEMGFRRPPRRPLATCLAVTALVFVGSTYLLRADPREGVASSIGSYYYGRGEQIFALNDAPEGYGVFLRQDDAERADNAGAASGELAARLVLQNGRDLRDLLLDRGTYPAVVDHWNPRGRLHAGLLVPLFLFGLVLSLVAAARSTEQRLLQALLWGFSLPILLTSRVHIGRLIFIVPIIALLTALPLTGIIRWLASRQRPVDRATFLRQGAPVVAGLLVLIGAGVGWADWRTEIPPTGMALAVEQIAAVAADRPAGDLVYVFGDEGGREIELLNIAEIEVALGDRLRLVDSAAPDRVRGEAGPLLRYGAMLDRLADPTGIPGYCDATYLLAPGVGEPFLALTRAPAATCPDPLTYELLP